MYVPKRATRLLPDSKDKINSYPRYEGGFPGSKLGHNNNNNNNIANDRPRPLPSRPVPSRPVPFEHHPATHTLGIAPPRNLILHSLTSRKDVLARPEGFGGETGWPAFMLRSTWCSLYCFSLSEVSSAASSLHAAVETPKKKKKKKKKKKSPWLRTRLGTGR